MTCSNKDPIKFIQIRNIHVSEYQCRGTRLPIAYISMLHNYSQYSSVIPSLKSTLESKNRTTDIKSRENRVYGRYCEPCFFSVLIFPVGVPPLITQLDIQSGVMPVAMLICERERRAAHCLGEAGKTQSHTVSQSCENNSVVSETGFDIRRRTECQLY
jgi:hypothetical protein